MGRRVPRRAAGRRARVAVDLPVAPCRQHLVQSLHGRRRLCGHVLQRRAHGGDSGALCHARSLLRGLRERDASTGCVCVPALLLRDGVPCDGHAPRALGDVRRADAARCLHCAPRVAAMARVGDAPCVRRARRSYRHPAAADARRAEPRRAQCNGL
eukprot:Amastigsp_a2209_55.p4 type:complete len:156 gc:universal Amastigsp_a2209_55:593-1060(+)